MLRAGLILCVVPAVLSFPSPAAQACGPPGIFHQAGAARVDITPQEPVLLSGYASRGMVEISDVAQRISARAVAISSEGHAPAVLITVDNCGVPLSMRKRVIAALQDAGVPAERVAISSTHTHAAPMVAGVLENLVAQEIPPDVRQRVVRYTEFLTSQLIEAAEQAIRDLRPARLHFAVGTSAFAANRRTPGGPTDHDVPVLRVTDEQGRVRALVLGYACHCTSLPGVPFISGDWAGFASEDLEGFYDGAVALTVIGCGADQNPSPLGTLEIARMQGRALATEVRRIADGVMEPLTQPISCAYHEIMLDFATPPPRGHWEGLSTSDGITGHHARQMLAAIDSAAGLPSQINYPVQTWTFGDELAMVFLADEVVVDYSLRLKRELNRRRLWVAGYCNDQRCYIPSERVLNEGGYEGGGAMVWYGWPGPFAAGIEDRIIAEVHRQVPDSFHAGADWPEEFRAAVAGIDPSRTGQTLPLPPQAAVDSLQTHASQRAELVAAEPLVVDPVAIDWAADGSLWVAEMHDYPEGLDGKYAPGGRIRLLRDTDGDGEYDRGTLFLDGLPFPTGVTTWGPGVLICAAPDVLYAEDTDGDDVADLRRTVLTGFETHNYQARVNSLSFGLDNWLYAACGLFGGVLQTPQGQKIDLSSRDFRFRPDEGLAESVSGRTQQGRVRDDFGNWFGCTNGNLLAHYPAEERYLRRNPLVPPPPVEVGLGTSELFPPPGLVTFELTGPPGRPTAACGLGIYRDTLLGAEYYGNSFTCEPVNQLVHRRVLHPHGVTFTAERAPTETDREFLTSADPWFRPVQVRTGPDGALYVVDMCRYVIEHPRWIPPAARNAVDLRAGDTLGRIYRILPVDTERRTMPDLSALDAPRLVAALDSPNGTVRDLVQHLIVQRADQAAVMPLKSLVRESRNALTRIHALYALEGLSALSDDILLPLLEDPHAGVRCAAIALSETRLNDSSDLLRSVLRLVDDTNPRVQLQLASSLGECTAPEAATALGRIALASPADPWIRAAVLSSATPQHLPRILAQVLRDPGRSGSDPALADELLQLALRSDTGTSLGTLVLQIAPAENQSWTPWQLRAVAGIADTARRSQQPLPNPARQVVLGAMQTAAGILSDDGAPVELKIAAIHPAAAADIADLELLRQLLLPSQPPELQAAAISAFAARQETPVLQMLLAAWPSLSPASRHAVLDQILTSEPGVRALLEALTNGVIAPGELDAARRQQLVTHRNEELREMATRVLEGGAKPDREQIIATWRTHVGSGDAARGKQAFAKHCSACHRLDGHGHDVGPDLAALTNRSPDALLTAILDPGRDVDQRYAGYTVVTKDGRSFQGLLAAESSNAVTLKAQENKTQSILRADIEILQGTGKSMMPEGIERDITPETAADLIAYLGVGSSVSYRYAGSFLPDPAYPDDPQHQRLTDGIIGSDRFNDGRWIGVRAGDGASPGLVFDFGSPTDVRSIRIHYGVNHAPGGIHAPDNVTISFSDNGVEFGTDSTFTGFDDDPDGLGAYEISQRIVHLPVAGPASRFVRLDFANDGEWTFLSEISFNAPSGPSTAEPPQPLPPDESASTARQIADLVADVTVGTPDEYRNIPDIWRLAIAAGRRNETSELLDVLKQSLPGPDEPLRDWQAVVLGGGLINGLTQAGVWPGERITGLVADDESLKMRWQRALVLSLAMADDEQVRTGTRYDALRMVAMLPWETCKEPLLRYAAKDAHAELQQGAVSGLGDVAHPGATQALIENLPGLTESNQQLAAESLMRTPDRTRALLAAVAAGTVPVTSIPDGMQNQLREHPDETIRDESRRLFPRQ